MVRTHPETGEKVLFVSGFTTHFVNFHTPANVRYGQDFAPGASELLNYLIGRAAIPEYQVRWRWRPNSVAIWDNRCHPALRRPGLLAGGPQDGARRHRRRPPLLKSAFHPAQGRKAMNFLDDSLLPENQEDLVITVAPYGPEWMPTDFPEDLPITMKEHVQKAVDC